MSDKLAKTTDVIAAAASRAFESDNLPAEQTICGCGPAPCECGSPWPNAHSITCRVDQLLICNKHAVERGILPLASIRAGGEPSLTQQEWRDAISSAIAAADEAASKVTLGRSLDDATVAGYKASSAVSKLKEQGRSAEELTQFIAIAKERLAEVTQEKRLEEYDLRQLMKTMTFGMPGGMRSGLLQQVPDTWREMVERVASAWEENYAPEYSDADVETVARAWSVMKKRADGNDE